MSFIWFHFTGLFLLCLSLSWAHTHTVSVSICFLITIPSLSLSLSHLRQLRPVVPFGDSWLLVPLVDSLVTYGIHSNMAHNVNSESGLGLGLGSVRVGSLFMCCWSYQNDFLLFSHVFSAAFQRLLALIYLLVWPEGLLVIKYSRCPPVQLACSLPELRSIAQVNNHFHN